MSRTLTEDAGEQAAATSATPINIVKIEFGGAVGTKYYSDRDLGNADASTALNAKGRIVSWGNINQLYAERTYSPIGDTKLTFADGDKVLWGYFKLREFQNKKITIYQYWAGLLENDLQAVLVGVFAAPVSWNEKDATVTADVTDISTRYHKDIGTLLDKEDHAYLGQKQEGAMVPLAFGRVKRSPMIPLCDGPVTELAKPCFDDSTQIFVMDAERFPQNTPITIHIDNEIITGSFAGNVFTVTARGADIVDTSHVTATRDALSFYDRTLSNADATYQGYMLEITDPVGNVHNREITAYAGAEHCVIYWPEITYPLSGETITWTIPVGAPYKITSWANDHDAGEQVFLGNIDYVYLVNDAPSKAIRYIEGLGEWSHQVRMSGGDSQSAISVEYGPALQGWMRINNALWSSNRNDTSIFGVDHPVTTITFGRHPNEFMKLVQELRITFDGVESDEDGTGTLYQDPSDIISCLLTRFGGVDEDDIDAASFAFAKADGTEHIQFGFTLTEQRNIIDITADLAFQARCALLWDDGLVRLQFLRNKMDAVSQLTLAKTNIIEDTLSIERRPRETIYSEVNAVYSNMWNKEAIIAKDEAVEAAYGRKVLNLNLWAFRRRDYARAIANFWLDRYKSPWTRAKVKLYLPALKLQRRDTITLNWTDFFDAGQKARVMTIDHQPGNAEEGLMDTIGLDLELPIKAGCTTICETDCETSAETGCYTQCEASAESCWQCETSCEEACELCCVTASELGCVSFDTGCGGSCETGCQAYCETACETGCEVGCESGGCQTSGCETGGCETWSCQTGGCETGGCQTGGCEGSSCQTGGDEGGGADLPVTVYNDNSAGALVAGDVVRGTNEVDGSGNPKVDIADTSGWSNYYVIVSASIAYQATGLAKQVGDLTMKIGTGGVTAGETADVVGGETGITTAKLGPFFVKKDNGDGTCVGVITRQRGGFVTILDSDGGGSGHYKTVIFGAGYVVSAGATLGAPHVGLAP